MQNQRGIRHICNDVRLVTYPEFQRVGIEARTPDGQVVALAMSTEQIEGLAHQIADLKAANWGELDPMH